MSGITLDLTQLRALATLVHGLVRFLRRLAIAAVLGVFAIAALLARDGVSTFDGVMTMLLLVPSAILLFFAQGVRELLALPDRILRMPREGQERLAELTRVAGAARSARMRGIPLLLWRLRGSLGSVRSVAGVAMPLRVLTPVSLGLALAATLSCMLLAVIGVIALLVVAAG